MTKAKGRVNRERRLADLTIVPASPDEKWWPPDPEHTETWPITIDLGDLGRVIGRTEYDDANRMTEFSLTAQIFYAGEWRDVARVDTAHATVHKHQFYRRREEEEPEVVRYIRCQNDVDRGYKEAESLLIVGWEDNVRRWDQ